MRVPTGPTALPLQRALPLLSHLLEQHHLSVDLHRLPIRRAGRHGRRRRRSGLRRGGRLGSVGGLRRGGRGGCGERRKVGEHRGRPSATAAWLLLLAVGQGPPGLARPSLQERGEMSIAQAPAGGGSGTGAVDRLGRLPSSRSALPSPARPSSIVRPAGAGQGPGEPRRAHQECWWSRARPPSC